MKLSQLGLNLIKKHEGLRLKAYRCPGNVLTIGYGHTGKDVKEGMVITDGQAERLLIDDVKSFEADVNRLVKSKINQNQFDALVSFCFNVGPAKLASSTLLKCVNANPYSSNIRYEFSRWNKAGGQVLKGLEKRRADEADLYFKPV